MLVSRLPRTAPGSGQGRQRPPPQGEHLEEISSEVPSQAAGARRRRRCSSPTRQGAERRRGIWLSQEGLDLGPEPNVGLSFARATGGGLGAVRGAGEGPSDRQRRARPLYRSSGRTPGSPGRRSLNRFCSQQVSTTWTCRGQALETSVTTPEPDKGTRPKRLRPGRAGRQASRRESRGQVAAVRLDRNFQGFAPGQDLRLRRQSLQRARPGNRPRLPRRRSQGRAPDPQGPGAFFMPVCGVASPRKLVRRFLVTRGRRRVSFPSSPNGPRVGTGETEASAARREPRRDLVRDPVLRDRNSEAKKA